jgi:hypothetical protein
MSTPEKKKVRPTAKSTDALRKEKENLVLRVQVARLRKIANQYDAVEGSGKPSGGGNKRRQAIVEWKSEDEMFPVRKRNLGLNLQREALRNYATHKGQIKQIALNTVGPFGRLSVLTDDDWGKRAGTWFNSDWAENAEFRAGLHWGELLQLVVSAIANEGDCVLQFDDGAIEDTGKIISFESDQIANINDRLTQAITQHVSNKSAQMASQVDANLENFAQGLELAGKAKIAERFGLSVE